jgi:hypothetical protein
LKVISRTSTQHYKSAPKNLPQIARQLGVAHVLEGSVQKSGDAVRVNVQLIKAANDSHLWANTFDRKLTTFFGRTGGQSHRHRAKLTGEEASARRQTDRNVGLTMLTCVGWLTHQICQHNADLLGAEIS